AATSSAARAGYPPAEAPARRSRRRHRRDGWCERGGKDVRQYAALYWASDCLSSFMMVAGTPLALWTLSVHCFSSGSADFFHLPSFAAVVGGAPGPGSAFALARAPCSQCAHGSANSPAHSVVQWSSMTFFCAADMAA